MAKTNTAIIVIMISAAVILLGYSIYKDSNNPQAITNSPETGTTSESPAQTPATGTDTASTATSTPPAPAPAPLPKPSAMEEACVKSGGTVAKANCCLSAADFPSSCAIGACGCAPAYSHEIKTCICPQGMCFSGTACVQPQSSVTYYCSADNCATRQINAGGIVTLARDCYRNLADCQAAIPTGTITVYCAADNCAARQMPMAAAMPQGCRHNQNDCQTAQPAEQTNCQNDSDCVPAECCHPASCINTAYKNVCGLLCTQECSGPLDCGAGSCRCVNNRCAVTPSAYGY